MGSLPEQLAANLATLQRLQLEQQTVDQSLRAARDRLVMVEKNLTDQIQGAAVPTKDPLAELRQLRGELVTLRTRYTEEHPDVHILAARIAKLEAALTEAPPPTSTPSALPHTSPQVEQARLDVTSLERKANDLDARIASFQA